MSGLKSQNFQQIEDLDAQILVSIKDNEEETQKYAQTSNSLLLKSKSSIHDQISNVIVSRKAHRFTTNEEELEQNSRESFSALNEQTNQSSLKSKVGSKISYSNQTQFSKQMKLFNQSIFTQRRQMEQSLRGRPVPQIQEEYNQPVNYEKSFYLTKKQEPINHKQNHNFTKEPENQIKVIFRNTKYFIEIGSESVEVDTHSLQDLYNELFKRQIFVPLFSYQIYQKWNQIADKDNKYDQTFQLFIHLKIYLEKYVKYLNEYSLKQMQQILKTVRIIQQGGRDKKKQAYSYFQFDLKSILENVKHMIAETKTQVLRRTLLAKIRSIAEAFKEREKYKISAEQKLTLQKTIQRTWIQLGNIELLLNFQRTIGYCTKKIENSPQTKFKDIWIKYREVMNRQRNKFVSKLDLINL